MKALIAGNWKMNLNLNEAIELVEKLKNSCSNARDDILICPSFVYLQKVGELIKDSNILLGAQNMYFEKKGAAIIANNTYQIINSAIDLINNPELLSAMRKNMKKMYNKSSSDRIVDDVLGSLEE